MSARHTPARLVVGMSGATGAIIGVRLLERLREIPEVQTHLVISRWARSTIEWETSRTVREVSALADVSYSPDDQAAAISSGSFRTIGMIVAPCSMKTVAAIRSGYADGLLARAADVTLKERRKLVLVPRETPLNDIHLDNPVPPDSRGHYHQPVRDLPETGEWITRLSALIADPGK